MGAKGFMEEQGQVACFDSFHKLESAHSLSTAVTGLDQQTAVSLSPDKLALADRTFLQSQRTQTQLRHVRGRAAASCEALL